MVVFSAYPSKLDGNVGPRAVWSAVEMITVDLLDLFLFPSLARTLTHPLRPLTDWRTLCNRWRLAASNSPAVPILSAHVPQSVTQVVRAKKRCIRRKIKSWAMPDGQH
jgi:hypothetical protein